MVTIITKSTEAFSLANDLVYRIDLIVILILIALLIFKELLFSCFDSRASLDSGTITKGKLVYIVIIPFLYIFSYVLIYRVFHPAG